MTPPRKEEQERRHWRAFWDEVPAWAKGAIIALGTWAASGYAQQTKTGCTPETIAKVRELEKAYAVQQANLEDMREDMKEIKALLRDLVRTRRAEIEHSRGNG